ncbi:hypothetical protein PHYSODRAFT_329180 [Phytophthora sojae]|uniref:Uncharacterized protein n=1 Tax=Phytophthora sojae (strain P6497) TaxID=1094619 RepID=G4ZA21_PHYSP|nr:hypothetical protein PHYSODRAFT_329180 [Phytophthora sojae]EGZ21160.1 hypothetical protein PHYSODRAFT_329180 [Phytophthora sojae]|eukprot:XP_009523877.1 hypothetical protein PHYSODRAFT_329180 [Phytophthora sojae]
MQTRPRQLRASPREAQKPSIKTYRRARLTLWTTARQPNPPTNVSQADELRGHVVRLECPYELAGRDWDGPIYAELIEPRELSPVHRSSFVEDDSVRRPGWICNLIYHSFDHDAARERHGDDQDPDDRAVIPFDRLTRPFERIRQPAPAPAAHVLIPCNVVWETQISRGDFVVGWWHGVPATSSPNLRTPRFRSRWRELEIGSVNNDELQRQLQEGLVPAGSDTTFDFSSASIPVISEFGRILKVCPLDYVRKYIGPSGSNARRLDEDEDSDSDAPADVLAVGLSRGRPLLHESPVIVGMRSPQQLAPPVPAQWLPGTLLAGDDAADISRAQDRDEGTAVSAVTAPTTSSSSPTAPATGARPAAGMQSPSLGTSDAASTNAQKMASKPEPATGGVAPAVRAERCLATPASGFNGTRLRPFVGMRIPPTPTVGTGKASVRRPSQLGLGVTITLEPAGAEWILAQKGHADYEDTHHMARDQDDFGQHTSQQTIEALTSGTTSFRPPAAELAVHQIAHVGPRPQCKESIGELRRYWQLPILDRVSAIQHHETLRNRYRVTKVTAKMIFAVSFGTRPLDHFLPPPAQSGGRHSVTHDSATWGAGDTVFSIVHADAANDTWDNAPRDLVYAMINLYTLVFTRLFQSIQDDHHASVLADEARATLSHSSPDYIRLVRQIIDTALMDTWARQIEYGSSASRRLKPATARDAAAPEPNDGAF